MLADAETPPFQIDEDSGEADETLRLRYRYLDLRREHDARRDRAPPPGRALDPRVPRVAQDFLEIETPILTRSTPEGARDFLVPSRLQPGSFYALPQSPQLFKQLLMMSGFERYYQIARCFRDEAQRADRQAEFTQLDIELSFVDEDDVIDVNERLMQRVLGGAGVADRASPLPRMSYDEAMRRYGTDRPDTRFGLEIADLTRRRRARRSSRCSARAIDEGGVVRGINAGRASCRAPSSTG